MTIHYSVSNHVATVSLDRPEALNALDLDSLKELRAALAAARDDDDVRVIVLTGAGRKSFCVGADLKNTLPPSTSFSSSFVRSIDRAAAEGIYVRLMDLSSLRIFKPIIARDQRLLPRRRARTRAAMRLADRVEQRGVRLAGSGRREHSGRVRHSGAAEGRAFGDRDEDAAHRRRRSTPLTRNAWVSFPMSSSPKR